MPEDNDYQEESKIYIIKKRKYKSDDEEVVKKLAEEFASIMAANAADAVQNAIARALHDPYSPEQRDKFIAAFESVFATDDYRLKMRDYEDVWKQLQVYQKKLEDTTQWFNSFQRCYNTCVLNGQADNLMGMQRALDKLNKILNPDGIK